MHEQRLQLRHAVPALGWLVAVAVWAAAPACDVGMLDGEEGGGGSGGDRVGSTAPSSASAGGGTPGQVFVYDPGEEAPEPPSCAGYIHVHNHVPARLRATAPLLDRLLEDQPLVEHAAETLRWLVQSDEVIAHYGGRALRGPSQIALDLYPVLLDETEQATGYFYQARLTSPARPHVADLAFIVDPSVTQASLPPIFAVLLESDESPLFDDQFQIWLGNEQVIARQPPNTAELDFDSVLASAVDEALGTALDWSQLLEDPETRLPLERLDRRVVYFVSEASHAIDVASLGSALEAASAELTIVGLSKEAVPDAALVNAVRGAAATLDAGSFFITGQDDAARFWGDFDAITGVYARNLSFHLEVPEGLTVVRFTEAAPEFEDADVFVRKLGYDTAAIVQGLLAVDPVCALSAETIAAKFDGERFTGEAWLPFGDDGPRTTALIDGEPSPAARLGLGVRLAAEALKYQSPHRGCRARELLLAPPEGGDPGQPILNANVATLVTQLHWLTGESCN